MKKNKINKVSLKMLSKRAFALAMGIAVLGTTATFLTGCDDGADGANGKTAYELAVDAGFTGTEEEWNASLNGGDGSDGTKGISAYVGYDGYIWNGAERTARKSSDFKYDANVVESTLAITKEMKEFYAGSYIDLSTHKIALMANYMPKTGVTRYSGLTIKSIKIIAEKSGALQIGTAKVADVVGARKHGGSYASNMSSYNVVAGENTISLTLSVEDDETIVIGGSGSVGVYFASGIPANDEFGNFMVIDGKSNIDLLSKTNDIDDTLAIEIMANMVSRKKAFDDILTRLPQTAIASSTAVNLPVSPFRYKDGSYFNGKKITEIGIPVQSVSAIDENQTFTLFVVKSTTTSNFATNYVEKYVLKLPVDELQGATQSGDVYNVNKWIYIDLSALNIQLEDDETLAFSDATDSVNWGYSSPEKNNSTYNFYVTSGTVSASEIFFDISVEDGTSLEEHLEKLIENENNA